MPVCNREGGRGEGGRGEGGGREIYYDQTMNIRI